MKVNLPSVAGGYNLQLINENFQQIANELNTKVFYRSNPVGEPNSLAQDMDMNGKRIYNLPYPSSDSEPVTRGYANDFLSGGVTAELVDMANQVAADKLLVDELATTATTQAGIAITQAALAITAAGEASTYAGSTFIQGGTGAVTQTMQNKARQTVNLDDFIDLSTFVNGVTDVTAQVQNAVNFVQASGSSHMKIMCSARKYNIVGTIYVTGPVRFEGEGFLDFENSRPITIPPNGSWFIHSNPTGPLMVFSGDLGKSSGLTNIAIFQAGHNAPSSVWVPTPHDWVIYNHNTFGTLILDRVHFHNVYAGVSTINSARPHYENITGQFFLTGFYYDKIYDLGKLDGVHAWTYWSENQYVLQWQQANSITVTIGRVDGLWIDRIFSFAAYITVLVTTGALGGTGRVINIGGLYSDFSGRALVVNSSVAHVTVSNLFHLGQAWPVTSPATVLPGACAVDIPSGSNHNVQINNLYSVLAEGPAIKVAGSNNQVWIASTIIEQYDRSGAGHGAFLPTTSNLIHLGATPSINKYGGGATKWINGTPGGSVTSPTISRTTTSTVNYPVTAGAASGQLVPYTAEGEANSGVALLASGVGTTQVGAAANRIGFYGSIGDYKGAITGATNDDTTAGALWQLLEYLQSRGILTNSATHP